MNTIKLNIKGCIKEYNVSNINHDDNANYAITFESNQVNQMLALTETLIKNKINFDVHNEKTGFIIKFQYNAGICELSEKDAIETNIRTVNTIANNQDTTISRLKVHIACLNKTIDSLNNTTPYNEIFAKYFKDELLAQRNSLNNAVMTIIADKGANLKLLSVYKRDLEWYGCSKHEAK